VREHTTQQTDSPEVHDVVVERSTVLGVDLEQVRAALEDPELLTAWLGAWRPEGEGAVVRTDDGTVRRVQDVQRGAHDSFGFTWAPVDRPGERSRVVFDLTPVDGGTRLTVRETWTPEGGAAPTLSARAARLGTAGERWIGCLLALGALLAARSTVAA
jgi:uncharacterized protein YndB with AHSA1/START domain